jgi:hypothetical protein
VAGDDSHAAGGARRQRGVEAVERGGQALPEPVDEAGRVDGLAQRGVVHLPRRLEVAG